MTSSPSRNPDDIFAALSPQEEGLLVSLPYRMGLYVSYADVTGGWEAQEKEQQSLANILRQYSEDFCKSAFCQKVLMETLIRRTEWPSWAQKIDSVPDQAGQIVGLLSSHLSDKELKGFKEVLTDIAVSVAMAFRENHNNEERDKNGEKQNVIVSILSKIKGGDKSQPAISHTHISSSERAALARVCTAMKYKFEG